MDISPAATDAFSTGGKEEEGDLLSLLRSLSLVTPAFVKTHGKGSSYNRFSQLCRRSYSSKYICSAAAVDMNISTDDVVCMCESTCYVYGCQLYFQLLISISMYGNCPIGSGVVVLFF